jgi:NADH:ubiquinone oxidoreductase subunit 4 (subunit M)
MAQHTNQNLTVNVNQLQIALAVLTAIVVPIVIVATAWGKIEHEIDLLKTEQIKTKAFSDSVIDRLARIETKIDQAIRQK